MAVRNEEIIRAAFDATFPPELLAQMAKQKNRDLVEFAWMCFGHGWIAARRRTRPPAAARHGAGRPKQP